MYVPLCIHILLIILCSSPSLSITVNFNSLGVCHSFLLLNCHAQFRVSRCTKYFCALSRSFKSLHIPSGRLLATSESASYSHRDSGRDSNISSLGISQIAVGHLQMFYQTVVSHL